MDYERDGFAGSSGSQLRPPEGGGKRKGEAGREPGRRLIDPLVVNTLIRIGSLGRAPDGDLTLTSPLAPASRGLPQGEIDRFVTLLRDGHPGEALAHATALAADLADCDDVFTLLLEPAANRVGELWRADTCDFLDVTLVMSRLQRLFRRLSIALPAGPAPAFRRAILLAPSPGEQHNFGVSIVAERFSRRGWTVDHRATVTAGELATLMASGRFPVVGLSLSAKRLLPELSSTIDAVRARAKGPVPAIMVGGLCVAANPHLVGEIGADFAAVDVDSAIAFAESRLSSEPWPIIGPSRSRRGFPHAIPPPGRGLVVSGE